MSKNRTEKEILKPAAHIGELAERLQVKAKYLSMGHWVPRHKLAAVGAESVKGNRLKFN